MNLESLKKQDKVYARAIGDYLLERIKTDEPLRNKLVDTSKTLAGCVRYVKEEARKQAQDGVAMVPDNQVFEWVVHYFLEDSLNKEDKLKEKKEVKSGENTNSKDTIHTESNPSVPDTSGDSVPIADSNSNAEKVEEAKEEKKQIAKAEEKVKKQMTLFDLDW